MGLGAPFDGDIEPLFRGDVPGRDLLGLPLAGLDFLGFARGGICFGGDIAMVGLRIDFTMSGICDEIRSQHSCTTCLTVICVHLLFIASILHQSVQSSRSQTLASRLLPRYFLNGSRTRRAIFCVLLVECEVRSRKMRDRLAIAA